MGVPFPTAAVIRHLATCPVKGREHHVALPLLMNEVAKRISQEQDIETTDDGCRCPEEDAVEHCIHVLSYDGGSTRMMTRTEILLIVVWARGMGRS